MAKYLVIVESPAKAKMLGKFLGKDYIVEASIGHVRDLPESAKTIPAKYKKEAWARLGVDVENGFAPLYVVSPAKKDQIKKLKAQLERVEHLYLATDEDREGESISWHLKELLKPKVPYERLVYHEVTKEAIQEALQQAREIDEDLVKAQEARRIVDRLYGYAVSPLLWKKIKPRLSAGRVQSVAVRLVVEREEARLAFHSAEFWDLELSARKDGQDFQASLVRLADKRVASGKDFDPATGALKDKAKEQSVLLGEKEARELLARLENAEPEVQKVESKPYTDRPSPPFTTSTLQQDANRRFRYAARRTMDLAQRLYENGFITYMRTDSVTLSGQALSAARSEIQSRFGKDFLPEKPRFYKSKVKNAQEAHEAIRPAGQSFTPPAVVEKQLGQDARKLYELVYQRTLASQMTDAKGHRVSVEIGIEEAVFQCGGKVVEFPGFLLAYGQGNATKSSNGDKDAKLPKLAVGDHPEQTGLEAKMHATQPPARLTEASLVRELEARGIGRPSTYASIIETILRRNYVRKQGTALIPTYTAFAVTRLLREHLSTLVDYDFTAQMENQLDAISLGELDSRAYLSQFYLGNGQPGLQQRLEAVQDEIDPRVVCGIKLGEHEGKVVEVRVGRYGPFLSHGDQRASLPEETIPSEFRLEQALEFLKKAAAGPKMLGKHPELDLPVYVRTGRYGPYVQLGDMEEGSKEKPKMASLLAGMDAETLSFEEALGLLSLPRKIGENEAGEDVLAANGRYGPYVMAGKETRSLNEVSPLEVTLAQALALLKEPKKRGRRTAARREPLKVLREKSDELPEVKILDGRFGPYVTDGSLNASVPKGTTVEEVTLDMGLELLAQRAEKDALNPKKKRATGKKKASKKKAKKKAAKKKAAKKKATKKKASTKRSKKQ